MVFLVSFVADYLNPRTDGVGLMFFVGVPLHFPWRDPLAGSRHGIPGD
jgi:hypothetical protein